MSSTSWGPGPPRSRDSLLTFCTAQQSLGSRSSGSNPTSSQKLVLRTGAVVIDPGSRSCRAGFCGEETPRVEIDTGVGCPMAWPPGAGEKRSEASRGEEALPRPEADVQLMQKGIITNWEAAGSLWQHLFDHELQVPPEEYALLLTEPPLSPSRHREKVVELVFEALGCPGFFVSPQPVLAAYAHGTTSGLVVDLGHAVSSAVPVHEGYSLAHATKKSELAGSHLSWYLLKLLEDRGYELSSEVASVVEDIKHKCCYAASSFEAECQLPAGNYTLDYALPDGQTISLSKERFQCPEILFNPPAHWGIPYAGIHDMAQRSLSQLPEEMKSAMCKNILLCGGSSLFEGLERRFHRELLQILAPSTKVKVAATALRRYSAWTGGSILSSLLNFQRWWIRRQEYAEEGPRIVHSRCY
ncbi:actin-like protein 9 [Melanerpes formicivorus]|uniref:actin-like protein 9 n=1 Tax=Melanerpes formicivorus TaxID=211600 RepID=UPI0035901EFE